MQDFIQWDWLDCHGLLHEAIKQLATVHRFAAVEPKRKLIQVIAQVFVAYCTLMGSHLPAFALEKTEGNLEIASSKAGMDAKTARKYRRLQRLPSELPTKPRGRRPDPFADVWSEVREQLEVSAGLEAKTLFEYLQRRYTPLAPAVLLPLIQVHSFAVLGGGVVPPPPPAPPIELPPPQPVRRSVTHSPI